MRLQKTYIGVLLPLKLVGYVRGGDALAGPGDLPSDHSLNRLFPTPSSAIVCAVNSAFKLKAFSTIWDLREHVRRHKRQTSDDNRTQHDARGFNLFGMKVLGFRVLGLGLRVIPMSSSMCRRKTRSSFCFVPQFSSLRSFYFCRGSISKIPHTQKKARYSARE